MTDSPADATNFSDTNWVCVAIFFRSIFFLVGSIADEYDKIICRITPLRDPIIIQLHKHWLRIVVTGDQAIEFLCGDSRY